jgi:hypothetical protein
MSGRRLESSPTFSRETNPALAIALEYSTVYLSPGYNADIARATSTAVLILYEQNSYNYFHNRMVVLVYIHDNKMLQSKSYYTPY